MRIELITIGDELLSGKTIDRNAAYMAEKLTGVGADVVRITTVGDTVEQIEDALKSAGDRAEAVIATGGLGPTPDDVTRRAMAKTFGRELIFSEDIFDEIEKRWIRRGKSPPASSRSLALIPNGAEVIPNKVGAAAGLKMRSGDTLFFFLPGVPEEMRSMMEDCVLPLIAEKAGGKTIRQRLLRTTGISETVLCEKLEEIEGQLEKVKIAYLPQLGEVHLRLTIGAESVNVAEERISEAEKVVRNRLGYYIYGTDDESLEEVVASLLLERRLTISVAESCTGGLILSRLTDIPGSSNFLERGVVAYSNKAKNEALTVPTKTLEEYGPVSAETARAMAERIRALGRTDIGIATTGILRPTGDMPEKPVGLVFFSLAHSGGSYHKEFRFLGDRTTNKKLAAQAALNELRLFLLR